MMKSLRRWCSNLEGDFPDRLGAGDGGMLGAADEILPCPTGERGEALAVLYRRVAEGVRDGLVAEALKQAERGGLDLEGLWIARRRGRVVGALLTQTLAGRAAAVWAPEVEPSWRRATIAAALLKTALSDLRARGARVAQALVDASSPPQAAIDLGRAGMAYVTSLAYLARDTADPLDVDAATPRLDWRGFGPETEAEFRAVLPRTYAGSLDLPELEGIRSLDDVLESHRAAGTFDPGRWRLGHVPGEPEAAAVLLLTHPPDCDCWEVAYLGLTREARGRGLGRAALAVALELARPHVPRLELAVDARNRPATRLYQATGFRAFDRRAVYLKVLGLR